MEDEEELRICQKEIRRLRSVVKELEEENETLRKEYKAYKEAHHDNTQL